MENIILITGVARSGISLIAGVIQRCGAQGGQTVKAMRHDTHGSLENVEIRDRIVRPFLRGIKADPNGQSPLPAISHCREIAKIVSPWWRKRIRTTMQCQGWEEGPIFVASPYSCLIWPIWADAYPRARWVVVRRKDEGIIESCEQTGYMKGYDTRAGWQGWIDAHKWRFTEMVSERLDVWQIWPDDMLRGNLTQVRRMVDHLRLSWNEAAVQDYLAPILWREGVFELMD